VSIVESKDPSLIGGAVVTFGDEQIDMSVRSALNQAAHSLTQGRTV
jgi:F0F1-type ATP synthase delta subunit